MASPGERRPPSTPTPASARSAGVGKRLWPRSRRAAIDEALLVALVAAVVWALLKGVLEFPGVLALAVVAGWLIGAILWQVRASPWLAALIAASAWVLGLVLTWLVSLAILPGSSRTLPERLASTPFLEWLSPQFGMLELAGLALYVLAALYGARPRS